MYERFREVQPKTPYIMLSRVDIDSRIDAAPEESVRMTNRQIVFDTYKYAKSQGDENVYFIDGAGIFKGYEDMATVDMCHPNDFGFFLMAKAIGDEIERALTQNSIK